MAFGIVRKSKFRHVFANVPKSDICWSGVKLSSNAWDGTNFACASAKWIAINWNVGGGGAAAIVDHTQVTRLEADQPLFTGHTGPILDMDFSPFNDDLLATVSTDAKCKLWQVPTGGLTESSGDSVQDLIGHKRKITACKFNPLADNVIATAGADYVVKLWNVQSGQAVTEVSGFGGLIQNIDWNYEANLMASAAKDKTVKLFDPRSGSITGDNAAFGNPKGGRCMFMGNTPYLYVVGFGRGAMRFYSVFDTRNFDSPVISPQRIDSSSGTLMPFFDEDTNLLFIAGKGDGNVRYYEFCPDESPDKMLPSITEYTSNDSTSGMAQLPKRAVDVNKNEMVRLFKITNDGDIQPLSFCVPRKSELFQDDIFPDCRTGEPSLNADEWFNGGNGEPIRGSMEGGFVPVERAPVTFEKKEEVEDDEPKTEAALRKAYRELKNRVAYLEAELAKHQ
jgi:coronin-1B/1C/6